MKNAFLLIFLLAGLSIQAQEVDVTFQVDMTGVAISPDGVHVAGDLNGWSTDGTPLTDVGNNIYSATVSLQTGRDIQFKFLNGNAWGTEEVPPLTCAVNGNNRVFTTPFEDLTLSAIPFNGCAAEVPTKMVTFKVDMSGQTVGDNGVHLAGNFQGWSPGSTRMTDVGGGIYEASVRVLNSLSVLQYKFINGNDWGMDEDPPAGCENFDNNRAAIADGTEDIVLPLQTFAGCENPIPVKEVTFSVDMTGFDVSPNGVHLAGNLQGWNPGGTPMTDRGNGIFEVTVSVPAAVASINYKFINGNDWGFDEDPPDGCANGDNNRFAALPLTTDAITVPGVLFGTCDAITSLSELVDDSNFSLIPSVSSDQVKVSWKLPSAEAVTLRVMNLNGQILEEEKIAPSAILTNRILQVSGWAPGMYLVYLQSQNAHSMRKLIVQ